MYTYILFPLPKKVSKIKGRGGTKLSQENSNSVSKSNLSKVPTILDQKGFASGEPNWD